MLRYLNSTLIALTLASTASASIPDFVTPGSDTAKLVHEGLNSKFLEIGNGRISGIDGLRNFGTNRSSIRRNHNSSLTGFKFKADDSVDLGDQNIYEKSALEFRGGDIKRAGGADFSVGIRSLNSLERMEGLTNQKHGIGDGANSNLLADSPLIGQVFDITSSNPYEITADGRKRVDPYVIEISFDEDEFNSVTSLTKLQELQAGCLSVVWLNTGIAGNIFEADLGDAWVFATQGNFANWDIFANLGVDRTDAFSLKKAGITGLNMSYDEYYAGTTTVLSHLGSQYDKEANSFWVGDFGSDLINNKNWAVVDHTSQFGNIPEPSTYALLFGVLSLGVVCLRRR